MLSRDFEWEEVEALFDAAENLPESKQTEFVEAETSSPELAREVLSLLSAARDSKTFLEATKSSNPALHTPLLERGHRLGAWRIDCLVGRGGMGDVYKVNRADGQYEHVAALKLMRAVSEEYREMFNRERQLLARLEHPGIARLLDGGITEDERPWMVMELASGAPIDKWVRSQQADIRQIVRLVIAAGDALAYAHRQLIVHRDIKPSNILVDDKGRTRVIDFGVAHFAETDAPRQTPLSLNYAAPELLDGSAASTASDIYGLAATLYALLAGTPPLDLAADPLPIAVRRAMEEPPRPLAEAMAGTPSKPLLHDLEAILACALSKRPADRYASLNAFCEDLKQALQGHAVHARKHERGYISARFVRRHAWQTAAITAVILSMAGGLSASLWQAHQASIERDWAFREQARMEAVQQYLYFMLRDGADASGGTQASADEILDAAAEQVTEMFANDPEKGAPVMHTLGELYFYLNDYEAAAPMFERIVESEDVDPIVMASAQYDLAQVRIRAGHSESAAPLLEAAQAFWRSEPDRWQRRLVNSQLVEARLLRDEGKASEAAALLEDSLPDRIALGGDIDRKLGVHYNDLGVMRIRAGQPEQAIEPLREALKIWKETGLENSPDALNTLNNLAAIEVVSGRYGNAVPLFRDLLDLRRILYGSSTATAAVLNNYGKTLLHLDRPEEALPLLEEASAMALQHGGEASMAYASAVAGLAEALSRTGQFEDALETASTGYTRVKSASGEHSPMTAVTAIALAREMANNGDEAKARELLHNAEAVFREMGPGAKRQLETIDRIRLSVGQGRPRR